MHLRVSAKSWNPIILASLLSVRPKHVQLKLPGIRTAGELFATGGRVVTTTSTEASWNPKRPFRVRPEVPLLFPKGFAHSAVPTDPSNIQLARLETVSDCTIEDCTIKDCTIEDSRWSRWLKLRIVGSLGILLHLLGMFYYRPGPGPYDALIELELVLLLMTIADFAQSARRALRRFSEEGCDDFEMDFDFEDVDPVEPSRCNVSRHASRRRR